jgi:acetolactate synthase I/III small subunit
MKHVITAYVENQPGVLARIVGLISGRGFNIATLNVAPTQHEDLSRLTMTVPGDDRVLEQVTKQLNKLIDVVKVTDLTEKRYMNRELVLVEVSINHGKHREIEKAIHPFGARIISEQARSVTVEMVGEKEQIAGFLEALRPMDILDLSRTGVIAVARGE